MSTALVVNVSDYKGTSNAESYEMEVVVGALERTDVWYRPIFSLPIIAFL
jgi:hypothetical protein